VRAIVRDDQAAQATLGGHCQRLLQRVENRAVDGIETRLQSGVELHTAHAVSDIDQRRAPVAQDLAAAVLLVDEHDNSGLDCDRLHRATVQIEVAA
jgi:hypothetical protein